MTVSGQVSRFFEVGLDRRAPRRRGRAAELRARCRRSAGAHAERATFFPDPNQGDFPEYRDYGPELVVCTKESRRLIQDNIEDSALRRENLQLRAKCKFTTIQMAVNFAKNGYRIKVLPGVYTEQRWIDTRPPGCEDVYDRTAAGATALTYEEHRQCPNAQNLIAILGDTNGDRICDAKCNIQIEGTGDDPGDVQILGQKQRLNVIRADRADGIYLKNFTVEYSDFNNIYVLETNGFRLDGIVSKYSREYGILSFTSDHGIYENCDTSYSGDSGVYPGSGPQRAPRPAGRARPRLRDHPPQLQLAPQHHRDVGHRRQRHVGARQPVPRQLHRHHDGLLRRRPPGDAAGQLEVVPEPDLLEQQRPVQRRARRLLPAGRVEMARPGEGLPDVPGAGRHRAS